MAKPKKTKTVEESNLIVDEAVSDVAVEDSAPEVVEDVSSEVAEPVTTPSQQDNVATIERQRRRTLGFI
jgi:hypothetical protein